MTLRRLRHIWPATRNETGMKGALHFPVLAMLALGGAVVLSPATASAGSYIADPLTAVSGQSPFAACSPPTRWGGQLYLNSEVEPRVAVSPTTIGTDHLNVIGVWQQDRWSSGSAHGIVADVSHDGGGTWKYSWPHFSLCAGGTAANGGDYERASDPWITFSPNGDAYAATTTLDTVKGVTAVLISKSTDGGDTWSEPQTLARDAWRSRDDGYAINDKESITADPYDSRYVYAVWDHLSTPGSSDPDVNGLVHQQTWKGPAYFARTTDGGATWEPARPISNWQARKDTLGNQIAVLPNGNLVDVFNFYDSGGTKMGIVRSADRGETWSRPAVISPVEDVGVTDPASGQPLRTGEELPDVAVDPGSGALYVVWEDARFNGMTRDGIVLSKSLNGGATWSAPIPVNQVASAPAFTPTVMVAADGTVGVSYYDLRNTVPSGILATDAWLVHSHDGGATWSETRITPASFDDRQAPYSGGYFLGDYQGLTSIGTSFLPFFAANDSVSADNPTDIFVTRIHP
jgi:hypothetical protein